MVAFIGQKVEILAKEKNQPIHQWVYQVLRMNIIKLHMKPAQQISENEVAEALQTSRTPVREAFIRLAEDGLIKVTPQKRSTVSLIDLDQAREARFVRLALEKAVLREACGNMSAEEVAALDDNIRIQRDCRREKAFDRMLLVDNDFHHIIFRSCGKERSWRFLKKLDYNYDRLRTMVIPYSIDFFIEEHQGIRDIVAAGNAGLIDGIMDRHLTWEKIDEVVRDYPPEFFTTNA
jgi:DNA-binding GntR family transcriptional regulator